MALATYKELCIDAVDPMRMGEFWAAALHLDAERLDDGDIRLTGPTPEHTVWIVRVPEPVTVKQRVHLDLRAASPDDLVAVGASVVDADSFAWTVMRDPEGGELCAFRMREGSRPGLMGLVVDCDSDPGPVADWWAALLGGTRGDNTEHGFSYVELPGCPVEDISFVPVPEPKTLKNRVHVDVWTDDLDALVAAGARLLRGQDDEIEWNVMADPWGNEFCAFGRK